MEGTTKKSKPKNVPNRRDHMANERTFLAWVRTSIGIMAFGFVVEKFALFMNRLSHVIEKKPSEADPSTLQYSKFFAIILVTMGACMDFWHLSDIKRLKEK